MLQGSKHSATLLLQDLNDLESMMAYDFHGSNALVTGASRGLGREFARNLARRGSHVILVARSGDQLNALAAEIRAETPSAQVETITADLGAPAEAAALAEKLASRGTRIDLLVNNAGAGSGGAFLDSPIDSVLSMIQLNVSGLVALTSAIGSTMRARRSGGIINVASTLAFQPVPMIAAYSASKAFVLSFTEALADELRVDGVHVMIANPGSMSTSFYDGTKTPIDPRAESPAEVAEAILNDFDRGKSASYPGRWSNRASTWMSRFLPRTQVTKTVGSYTRQRGRSSAANET
jgi:short-subunit dehydrogenase